MFVAMNHEKQVINCLEEKVDRSQVYYCPQCQGKLRFRSGSRVRPHFAHLSSCPYLSENESAQHLGLKERLYQWGKRETELILEAPMSSFDQIADLYFPREQLALEVQCSPLSIARLKERTRAYQEAGIQVLWLLGEGLWLKEHLTKLQQGFLYFSKNRGFHIWELDLKKGEIRLKYLIHQDWRNRLVYQTMRFAFEEEDLLQVLRTPFSGGKMESFTQPLDHDLLDYIRRQLYYRDRKWMALQEKYYLQGHNILACTYRDFYPHYFPPLLGELLQVRECLDWYYQDFYAYYRQIRDPGEQKLYPPAFYRQIKR